MDGPQFYLCATLLGSGYGSLIFDPFVDQLFSSGRESDYVSHNTCYIVCACVHATVPIDSSGLRKDQS